MVRKIFFVLPVFFFAVVEVLSQPAVRLPFNKKISVDDGLSSYNIKKILQDKYGFIWILTQDGLNRYDGRNFLIYNKSADHDHRLLESDVWDVEEDTNRDTLWIATAYGGVNAINLKTGKVCFELKAIENEGVNNNWLRCFRRYKDDLWIGTYNGLVIYNIKTKSFGQFDPLPLNGEKNKLCVDKLVIDQYENAWLLIANYGIVIYSCKTRKMLGAYPLSKLSLKYEATFRQFQSVLFLPDGTLLAATNQGFRRFIASRNGSVTTLVGLYDGDTAFNRINIDALGIDSFQHTWFAASSRLYKYDQHSKTLQEIKDANISVQNDWFNNIHDIFFDRGNNIWLGTQRGVAFTKNVAPVFTSYYVSEDLSERIDHALYLYPFSDSVTYACTETGLLKVNTFLNTITRIDKGKAYFFMTRHVDKNFLVSNQYGFFMYKPANNSLYEISLIYAELAPMKTMTINSLNYIGDSLAVLGTENGDGFFVWNYKKKLLRKISHGAGGEQATQIVNTCYTDKKNRVWILGDKFISVYDPNTMAIKNLSFLNPASNTHFNFYFDVCEAKDYFWIAVYGAGLIQLNKDFTIKKIFSTPEGLSNAGVYKLFPIHDSLIFITTNKGLSVLNIGKQSFTSYFLGDGLHSNSFEEGCGFERDGKIYAGGVNGFTVINPRYLTTNTVAPGLYLNHIRIETESGITDTSNLEMNTLHIPNDVLQTTLHFSALNYSDPSRAIYAYKIKELNKNWINLGTQNSVSIMGIQPGRYTLLVKSANEDGIWNDQPVQLSMVFLPKWYQTWLFKILVALVIAGLLYSFYAYRISQLKTQQKIRKDISADLHDDIGSILEGIRNYTHLAKREPDKPDHLKQIEESLTLASNGFRDIIWILDDKLDTINQFVERIKKLVSPIANACHVHLACTVEPGIGEKTFSKAEKRHLLMIAKESINNCIKYAACSNINVAVRLIDHKITLLIEDDGKGFVTTAASEGNGLKNIRYRCQQIGYTAEIISKKGAGTLVRVTKG